jgi:hypothetical protein
VDLAVTSEVDGKEGGADTEFDLAITCYYGDHYLLQYYIAIGPTPGPNLNKGNSEWYSQVLTRSVWMTFCVLFHVRFGEQTFTQCVTNTVV